MTGTGGRAARRLRLVAAAAGLPPAPERTAEEVRRTVEEVLSRPEYQPERPSLLQRLLEWVDTQISNLLDALLGGGAGSAVGALVFVLIVLLVVGLAVWLARGVTPDPAAARGGEDEPGRPAEAWLAEAERLEADGDWLRGLRCRYRALVAVLAAAGVVEEVPGTTTGAYLRQVRANAPAAAGAFAGATELFERAWYGRHRTGEAESGRFRDLDRQVRAAVAVPVGAPR